MADGKLMAGHCSNLKQMCALNYSGSVDCSLHHRHIKTAQCQVVCCQCLCHLVSRMLIVISMLIVLFIGVWMHAYCSLATVSAEKYAVEY